MKPRRPELTAAIVNGLVVLAVPLAFVLSVTLAYGPGPAETVLRLGESALILLPFALLAGWRTWVYAKKMIAGQGRGWRGVGEAAFTGFCALLIYLLPGIVTRPAEAPAYIIFYGAVAAVLGVLVGLTLRLTALFVLWMQPKHA